MYRCFPYILPHTTKQGDHAEAHAKWKWSYSYHVIQNMNNSNKCVIICSIHINIPTGHTVSISWCLKWLWRAFNMHSKPAAKQYLPISSWVGWLYLLWLWWQLLLRLLVVFNGSWTGLVYLYTLIHRRRFASDQWWRSGTRWSSNQI